MQRFALIHDGSEQGWQTAYLAFHIAARLGAPLLALLVDQATDWKKLAQRAAQVEVGGRAAELEIRTRFVTDFSVEVLAKNSAGIDGLFIPRRLVSDDETAARLLESLSCPLWIVSKDVELYKMAVLVGDLVADENLLNYTIALSRRLQQSLTGLVRASELARVPGSETPLAWVSLADFSQHEVAAAFTELGAGLLFLSDANASMLNGLSMNCVFYPEAKNA